MLITPRRFRVSVSSFPLGLTGLVSAILSHILPETYIKVRWTLPYKVDVDEWD
jgi:hypothetical protein